MARRGSKNKLVSLDSTVIDLCPTLFDWAKFRRTKGAIKLHCLPDHDGYLPSVVVITEGKRHDVLVARTLRFDPGTVVVMDRGYVDYAWFGPADGREVFFVTRLKGATPCTTPSSGVASRSAAVFAGRDHRVDESGRREQMSVPVAPR